MRSSQRPPFWPIATSLEWVSSCLKILFAFVSQSPVIGINIIIIEDANVNDNNLAVFNKTYESVESADCSLTGLATRADRQSGAL